VRQGRWRAGSVKVKADPAPGLDSAVMVPPCCRRWKIWKMWSEGTCWWADGRWTWSGGRVAQVGPGLTVGPEASVGGPLRYTSPTEAELPPGVARQGAQWTRASGPPDRLAGGWALLLRFLGLLLWGTLAERLAPSAVDRVVNSLWRQTFLSMGLGLVVALAWLAAGTGPVGRALAFALGFARLGDLLAAGSGAGWGTGLLVVALAGAGVLAQVCVAVAPGAVPGPRTVRRAGPGAGSLPGVALSAAPRRAVRGGRRGDGHRGATLHAPPPTSAAGRRVAGAGSR
jgi:hypothetical protein